jgi:predicted RNA-binding Zn-ribbon protein involved in translation (DUF1610 family)
MSYYGIHNANIATITCANCQTEVFAWLADVFACPECGRRFHQANNSDGDEEMYNNQDEDMCDDENQEMYGDEDSDASTLVGEEDRVDRKRKREEPGEGDEP